MHLTWKQQAIYFKVANWKYLFALENAGTSDIFREMMINFYVNKHFISLAVLLM